jgi:hypothetical protein
MRSWRDAITSDNLPDLENGLIGFASRRWVTQVGGPNFNDEPRWHREISLSVMAGRHRPAVAVPMCFRRPVRATDRVRFFRIRELAAAEYLPYPAPSHNNPDHALIRAPIADDKTELHQAWWTHEDRVRLTTLARE